MRNFKWDILRSSKLNSSKAYYLADYVSSINGYLGIVSDS